MQTSWAAPSRAQQNVRLDSELSVVARPTSINTTFTATVSTMSTPASAPTGTVDFYYYNGSTYVYLGTGTLSSNGSLTTSTATYVNTSLLAGTYTILAHYNGDSLFDPADFTLVIQAPQRQQ